MDLLLLVSVAISLLVIGVTIYFLQRKSEKKVSSGIQRAVPVRAQDGIPRRAQIARNQRNRIRTTATAGPSAVENVVESEEEDDENRQQRVPNFDEKMGTKKRAKLEAKAERKAQREVEMQLREEKKKREALIEEERKKREDETAEEERKHEEAERLAREEKERKEHEEYLKLKEAFNVEEEGFEEEDPDKENLLFEFVNFIKNNKIVVLEDLANQFKLKTQQVIDRIAELQENGTLTGVIDDRGKFIYISEEELREVAKFIRQRGRVSITELAECSNKLINLTPVAT